MYNITTLAKKVGELKGTSDALQQEMAQVKKGVADASAVASSVPPPPSPSSAELRDVEARIGNAASRAELHDLEARVKSDGRTERRMLEISLLQRCDETTGRALRERCDGIERSLVAALQAANERVDRLERELEETRRAKTTPAAPPPLVLSEAAGGAGLGSGVGTGREEESEKERGATDGKQRSDDHDTSENNDDIRLGFGSTTTGSSSTKKNAKKKGSGGEARAAAAAAAATTTNE